VANGLTRKAESLQARIVSGSVVLLSGSGLTTAINLTYNVVVARFLGPEGFGQATVVYTLLTLLSAITLSFQIVSTKVVAQQTSPEGKAAAYRGFHRSAWECGLVAALLLQMFQKQIADYLNLPDSGLVALLAIGAAFYVPLGTRRGYIQGTYKFLRLAINLVSEGAVRLGGSFLLIQLGFGVRGVIAANAAAVAYAYLAIPPRLAARVSHSLPFSNVFRESSQALVFFSGQVLINNCDIVLVKHFFLAQMAGLYAAVAMVGRVIFAFSSAVVNSTFPLVAGTRHEERKDFRVIATSLLLVLGIGSALSLGLLIAPAWIWTSSFGAKFEIAGRYNLPYLLALYAITTVVYSLSVVIVTFEMSYKIANTSWVQLAFSTVLIAGICIFHSTLREVILVQFVLMLVLFVFVAVPFLIDSLTDPKDQLRTAGSRPLRLIRRVSEDEVIAEFLKSDFHCPEFEQYHEPLREIVVRPNFHDAVENAKRRALLYIRHLALWNEIPASTEWYEAELNEMNLDQIRIFPRAQWLKLARGNFSITAVTECVRARKHTMDAPFLSKISAIGTKLLSEDVVFGAVLLIGVNENEPLTVLDGNHRLVAAMLASPSGLPKLRFMCGLSPRMTDCCWYNTNIVTLFRYGKNVLTQTVRNPGAELARLMQDAG
jgi:O-antigen/teichoic acid export membrane protein